MRINRIDMESLNDIATDASVYSDNGCTNTQLAMLLWRLITTIISILLNNEWYRCPNVGRQPKQPKKLTNKEDKKW